MPEWVPVVIALVTSPLLVEGGRRLWNWAKVRADTKAVTATTRRDDFASITGGYRDLLEQYEDLWEQRVRDIHLAHQAKVKHWLVRLQACPYPDCPECLMVKAEMEAEIERLRLALEDL